MTRVASVNTIRAILRMQSNATMQAITSQGPLLMIACSMLTENSSLWNTLIM